MKNSKKIFDDYYNFNQDAFGLIPNQSMRDYVLAEGITGKALDLGCGNGRNSLFLAGIGLEVTAVDRSPAGIDRLRQNALKYGTDQNIKTRIEDVRDFRLRENSYDLISAVTILDHIPQKDLETTIDNIAKSLKPGGVFFAKVHTIDDPGYNGDMENASELAQAIEHYFKPQELRELVTDKLEVVKYHEFEIGDDTHGETHRHAFAEIIAGKTME